MGLNVFLDCESRALVELQVVVEEPVVLLGVKLHLQRELFIFEMVITDAKRCLGRVIVTHITVR